MTKSTKWLLGELDAWVGDGLIDAAQAAQIRRRYASAERDSPWARIIFSSIGAILFGLGLILLFAYNWQAMHKFIKLAVVFVFLIGVHCAGLWLRRPASKYPLAGEGLHVLGTIFFGAGIWLIAQIYHIDEHYPNGFLIWGLGALALAWTLPSVAQGIIAAVLLVFWHGSEVFEFDKANQIGIVLFLLLLPLAWMQRSRVLLFVVITALYFVLASSAFTVDDDLWLPLLFVFACLLLTARWLVIRHASFSQSAVVFSVLGWAAYFVLLFMLSFVEFFDDLARLQMADETLLYFGVFAIPTVALWGLVLFGGPPRPVLVWLEQGLVGAVLLMFLLSVVMMHAEMYSVLVSTIALTAIVLFNAALLAHGAIFIIHGSRHGEAGKAALGCLLVSALVVARYIDLFDSLLMRSLAFFIVGAIIFAAGNFYARHKPRPESAV